MVHNFIRIKDGVKHYFYTKTYSIPLNDLLSCVEKFFIENNKEKCLLDDLYNYIRDYFNIKTFNRNNLATLFNANRFVYFKDFQDVKLGIDSSLVAKYKNQEKKVVEYYNVTTTIKVPLTKVVDRIYDYFVSNNLDFVVIDDVYCDLRDYFGLKSFNLGNLKILLRTKRWVSFNVVEELYFKYKADSSVSDIYTFSLLKFLFIEKRLSILRVLDSLGFDVVCSNLNSGIESFIDALNQDDDSSPLILNFFTKEEVYNPNNAKMVLDLFNLFSYEEWQSLLTNPDNLESYIDMFIEDKKQELEKLTFKSYLLSYLSRVHSDNLKCRIKYIFDSHISNVFINNNLNYIEDIANITDEVAIELYNFKDTIMKTIVDMKYSYLERLKELYRYCYQHVNKSYIPNSYWETYVAILNLRAENETLQSVGDKFSLTRERVRQIERKYVKIFKDCFIKNNMMAIIRSLIDNPLLISTSDIEKLFPEYSKLFKYLLELKDDDNVYYIEEIDKFYFQDEFDWYKYINDFSETMPEQFHNQEIAHYVNEIQNLLSNKKIILDYADCEKILLNNFKQKGAIYTKSAMTSSMKIKQVLLKYFNGSYNVYDESFIKKFREYYKSMFVEDFAFTDRSLSCNISNVSIQVGRGEYVLADASLISEELANKIYEFIMNNERDVYLTNNLYSIFEEELKSENITNKYYMTGALRQKLADKLYFRRDYISRSELATSCYNDIANFVKKSQRLVDYEEIKVEFQGITDIVLLSALAQESILNYRKRYVHVDSLEIEQKDINFLRESLINFLIDNEIHHVDDMYAYIKLTNKQLLTKFFIDDYFCLYSLLEYLFSDILEMKRPYIANKGIKIDNQIDRINEFVYSFDELEVQSLLDFVYDNRLNLYSIMDYVDSLSNYIFKNEHSICLLEKSNLNKYNVEMVESLISKAMGSQGFVFADKLTFYSIMPKEVKWNPWLLYSALNKFGKKLKAIPSSNCFMKNGKIRARVIIIDNNIPANNKEELIEHLRSRMNLNDKEFYMYLQSKELV